MKSLSLYTLVILLSVVGINIYSKNVNAQRESDIDGNSIENPVEDPADLEDEDYIEGDEDVSVTETKEEDGDTSVVEESNENYADEMDEDILEDSVDTTDALEPKKPESR